MAQRTSPGLDGSNGGRQSATQSLYNCKRFTGDTESDDEEEGWCDTMPCPRQEGRLSALGTYREPLRSACLCFPHLELMFLLFAFEGAVASQAWAIGDGYEENPVLFCLALAALVGPSIYLFLFHTTQNQVHEKDAHAPFGWIDEFK